MAESPGRTVGGTVRWSPKTGWRLRLDGQLLGTGAERAAVICGRTTAGTEITLVDALGTTTTGSHGIGSEHVVQESVALSGFVGGHLGSPDDRRFANGSFSMMHLRAWMDEPLAEWASDGSEWVRPHDVAKREARTADAAITLAAGVRRQFSRTHVSWERMGWFEVVPNQRREQEDWIDRFVRPVTMLMEIATMRPSRPVRLRFEVPVRAGRGMQTSGIVTYLEVQTARRALVGQPASVHDP